MLATEWENLTVAGAFVLGITLGSIATIRVMRVVFGYIQPNHRIRGAKEPPPPGGDGGSDE